MLPIQCFDGFGMEWDQRISSNFFLRNNSSESSTTKWFQFWQGNREDYGEIFAVGASFRRQYLSNRVELMAVNTSAGCLVCNAAYSSPSPYGITLIGPDTPANGAIKPGQVHNIKWRVKFSSTDVAADGLWEMLIDNVLFATYTGAVYSYAGVGSPVPNIATGYLMGYCNPGYAAETVWTWDNLKFYNTTTRWW
jgi:hypothetical protein